jgi:hypothetical protein
MTITLLRPDGIPLTAKQHRQGLAPLNGAGSGRQLGGRSGFRVGTPSNILTATSTTWTLQPCSAMIDPGASTHQGMYGWATDSNISGAVTPADSTYARKDIVFVQVNDQSAGDGSGLVSADVRYVAGTPSDNPQAPALGILDRTRSFEIGTINVPQVGGGSPTVTLNPARFVAAGGILPLTSNAQRDALTPHDGFAVSVNGALDVYQGGWGGFAASTVVAPPDAGWAIAGGITRINAQGFKQCRATLKITRVSGPSDNINQGYNSLLDATIPAAFRPAIEVQGHALMSTTSGTFKANLECLIGTNGDIAFRVESGVIALAVNDVFYVDIGWWQ